MILSAKYFKPTSCVTITRVVPCAFTSVRSFITIAVFMVSKSPVGSSNNKIDGEFINDRAIVTLCCSPPDSCEGTWSKRSPIPTILSFSVASLFLSAALSFPSNINGIITFSKAVRLDSKLKV
mmetsp:Transcript_507/g.671  ORF Transcript_507/g.671 Transcript_507/m.671 type:complete len:123 (+) Transcript_507:280-648(+)